MTPDERDRLKALEVKVEKIEETLRKIEKGIADLNAIANRGRGGLATLLTLGGFFGGLAGIVLLGLEFLRRHP